MGSPKRENPRVPEGRNAEVERLRKELDRALARERVARAEVEVAHKRFEQLRSSSQAFAVTMRESAAERHRSRRRVAAQYAVGRVLADADEVADVSATILRILVEDLGWHLGIYWTLDGDRLHCHDLWTAQEESGERFEGVCRRLSLRRGEGLPGRAWAAGTPVWVEDVSKEARSDRDDAARALGLSSALAFSVRDGGRTAGVFELFGTETASPDEEMIRVAAVVGGQVGQFAERRKAERERERLHARERAARTEADTARSEVVDILGSISDAFVAFDSEWRFTYLNEAAGKLVRTVGRTPEDLPGRVVWEAFPELGDTEFGTGLLRALREDEVVEHEVYSPSLDAWFHARGYPSASGLSLYLGDVTERKKSEEVLRESERRFRALIYKGSDVITISDRDGVVRYASPSIDTVCGHPVEEFVGSNPFELGYIHPDDIERCGQAFGELVERPGHSITLQHRYRHESGEWRWLEGTFTSLFHDPAVGGLVSNFRDITERKRAEEEHDRLLVQEWVARAEAAERERVSRELHDRVAHSMGVAHQSLQLYEVLAKKDAARAAEKLELAKETTKAALESTRNLSAELRCLDVEAGLEAELRQLLDVAVPPGIHAEVTVEGDEAVVPDRLRDQLFLILREAVRNAVTHSECDSISVGLEIRLGSIVGSVEDDGKGFDTKNGHAGVGLRSMRERAALLDGTLHLGCEPGRGTRVAVSLPLEGGG